jgi:hypothetical protein
MFGFSHEGFEAARVTKECQPPLERDWEGVKGVRELLNLSCLVNYDTKKNPP